jgi:ParB/RepB/Spo0J family partition protein
MTEEFKYVLSDQIEVIEKFNPRREENYDVENLYHSIKEQNILTPLLVTQTSKSLEDGRPVYYLFEGHRRLKTLSIIENEDNFKRQVPVRIFEKMSEDELLMKALMLGVTGKQLKTSEKAKAIARLQSFGYDNKKIADMMRITQANISILKKFEKIPVSLQVKIDDELISFSETVKLMEQVSSVKTLEKIIDQAIQNKGGRVYARDIKELVTTTDDEEIKSVQTNITKDIKSKNVVDEDIHTISGSEVSDDDFFSITPTVSKPDDIIPSITPTVSKTDDVILSDDEVKKIMGFKPERTSEPKPKTTPLMKIYDYLMDKNVQQALNVNHSKIEILKAIMDYQDGLMDKDSLCDYFIDGE